MAAVVVPNPFVSGYRLTDGNRLNRVIAAGVVSSQDSITATAGGGQTNAFQLLAVNSRITTVVSPNDSIKLPTAVAGLTVIIDNDGANTMAVFPSGTDTLEDSTSAASLIAGQDSTFTCPVAGKWYQLGTTGQYTGSFTGTFTPQASQTGTFTANGATGVVVANTAVTANSCIIFGLKTIGGTPAGAPFLSAITAGTGFTVKVVAGDTSVYNYTIIG